MNEEHPKAATGAEPDAVHDPAHDALAQLEEGDRNEHAAEPESKSSTHQNPKAERRSGALNGFRLAVNVLAVALVIVLGILLWQRFNPSTGKEMNRAVAAGENSQETPAGSGIKVDLMPMITPASPFAGGIYRQIDLDTVIPSRTRSEVTTYTVKAGDNLFTIAENYGVKPETLLWGNYDILKDNPQLLMIDQVLNVLPVDGVYYEWKEGDRLDAVAQSFEVSVSDVLAYSGNPLDLTQSQDGSYGLQPGDMVIIPGGSRPLKDWGPPAISRSNPASAAYYGPGHCGSILEGAFGTGSFVWPTTERFLSGYHYSAIHRGIDIGGSTGNPIFAADSGVVVYSGWSNYGYGYLIVVDHGNGWQTAYAHMDTLAVSCGQSVGQGTYIGGLGNTGNSTGPHLHFELVYNGSKPNPMDYLQ